MIAPYRVLFPLGVLFGIAGTALWPLYALGWIPYPAVLHPRLMIQGFEHCFILGFLLTAMPSFLHAPRATRAELLFAGGSMAAFLVLAFMGAWAPAELIYIGTILLVLAMGARRFRREAAPPEEFLFVAFGLLLGIAGGAIEALASAGLIAEPAPRFGLRVISLGMVLSIVLGVGGLLVPTFTSMRGPLVIPGLARPHQRAPRRALYIALIGLLTGALLLDAVAQPAPAALVRAGVGTVMLLWIWKIYRLPGAKDILSWCLWSAGWLLLAGLWTAALVPFRPLPGMHVVFVGGLGLLTAGIATRVTVRHGNHPLPTERRVLPVLVPALLALALAARLAAEFAPARASVLYGVGGGLWILGWIVWGARASGFLARIRTPARPA